VRRDGFAVGVDVSDVSFAEDEEEEEEGWGEGERVSLACAIPIMAV